MKTTLNLNDRLMLEAKAAAARMRVSLTRLIEEGLQLRLKARRAPRPANVVIPVINGRRGLVPGVNPLSNRSLRDAIDRDA